MRKFYTMIAFVAMTLSAMTTSAASLSATAGLWGKPITSTASGNAGATQGSNLAMAKDGSGLYILGTASTSSPNDNVLFGSDVIATGIESTTSASGNNGLWLIKSDKDGNALWTVTSKYGEFTANSQYLAATSDGGVVLYLLARHTLNTVDFNAEHPVTLVDADGAETEIDWTIANETNRYGALLVKVSSEGKIEWTNLLDASTEPVPTAPTVQVSQGLYPAGLAITDGGDIFIAGRNVRDLYIDNVTISNHNLATAVANGGGMYVIKLDAGGHYVSHIVSGGESTKEAVLGLSAHGNNIYLLSLITGKADTEITLGDKSVTPVNAYNTLSVAKLDADLNVDYFSYYTNTTVTGGAMQTPFIAVQNGTLWIAGKAKIALDDINVTTGTLTRAALIVKADPVTGDLIAGKAGTVAQGGDFSVLVNNDNDPYVFGHVLNKPLTMSKLDATTLETVDEVQLYSQSSDTQGVVADGDQIFVMWRLAKQAGQSADGVITNTAPSSFSAMVGSYKLPEEVSTSIIGLKGDELNSVRVYGAHGVAHIAADKAQTVVVYNIAGARVAVVNAQQGDNTVSLAPGMYIAAGQKIVVR